jgi:putative ABC transport system ATP-binding protein
MTAGNVDFFGEELSQLSDKSVSNVRLNEMGFVFQQMYMLKNLSVYDNIILPAYQSKAQKML